MLTLISVNSIQGRMPVPHAVGLRASAGRCRMPPSRGALHLNHVHSWEGGSFFHLSFSMVADRAPGPLTPCFCPILSPNPFFSPAQLLPPSQGLTFFSLPGPPFCPSFIRVFHSLSPPSLSVALGHHLPFTPNTPFPQLFLSDPPLPFPFSRL